MHVLPLRSFKTDELPKRVAVGGDWILPVFLDRVPRVAQAFHITVPILRDDSGNSFGVRYSQTEAGWRAVIEHVNSVALQIQRLHKSINRHGHVGKRVLVLPFGRHLSEPK